MLFQGTWVFVRHGETDWNAIDRIQGRTDIPLNERGILQAKDVGMMLKDNKINVDLIVASTLQRAAQTARIISLLLEIPDERVVFDARMQECSFGAAEGKTKTEIEERFRKALKYVHGEPYDFRAFGGEHADDVLARQLAAISEHTAHLATHSEPVVLLVGHGRSLATLQAYFGAPYDLPQGKYSLHRART